MPANPDANPPVQKVAEVQTTGATFRIKNAKLYVLFLLMIISNF